MEELLFGLCVLTIVLAIVMVVGHGMWVLLAAIVRAASGEPPKTTPLTTRPESDQLTEVRASIRQVERLRQGGKITDRLRDGLIRTLREEEARLISGAPVVGPPPETKPAAEATPSVGAPETATPTTSVAPPAAESPAATPAAPAAAAPVPTPSSETEGGKEVVDAIVVADAVPATAASVKTPAVPAPSVAAPGGVSAPRPPAETAATAQPLPSPPRPREPEPPQRAFSDLLQAFMEERNIRWGELIGGMLIVGSGICLVISLWAQLQRFQYFPAFVFLAVTAGIFGAGMYTLRKWKLESTSRGLLIICVLLVPLNILAAIAISKGQTDVDALYLFVVAAGLAAYGAITYTAGRVLVPHAAWALLLAVMGTSAGQLVIDRTANPGMSAVETNVAFGLPLGCFLAGTISFLVVIRRRRPSDPALLRPGGHMSARLATETVLLLGAAVFALIMPLSLLAAKSFPSLVSWSAKSAAVHTTLADLAPALTTAAAVVLGFGLAIHQRVTRPKWARLRAAGTGLSVLGGMLLLLLAMLAWPDPMRLVIVGVLVFAALAILAVSARMPVLHTPAVISLATAILLGFHLYTGELPSDGTATSGEVLQVFILGHTSVVLTLVALAAGGVAWQLKRVKLDEDAAAIVWGAGSVAAVGLLSSLVSGFLWRLEDAAWASLVLGVGAIGLLLLGGRVRRGWVTSIGSVLLLVALLQVCMFNQVVVPKNVAFIPLKTLIIGLFPFLLHASVCCLFAVSTRWTATRRLLRASTAADLWRPVVVPLTVWALVTSSLVVLPCLFSWMAPNGWLAVCLFWTAAVWLVVALLRRWQVMFWLFQAVATAGLAVTISSLFVETPYSSRLVGLPHLFSQLAGLAGWSAVWSVVRRDCRRWTWLYELMTPPWPAVDRLCLYVAVAGVLVIAVAGCLPGIDAEMGAYGRVASGWGGNAGVLPRSVDFLQSHFGEASALILAVFLFWSLGSLSAWSLGAFRRHPQAVAMLVIAAAGSLCVWLAARVGIFVWQFDDIGIRFAATDTMWRLLMLVAVAVAVSFLNRVSTVDLVGLVCLAFAVPLLCAAWFEPLGVTASALCWGLSLCGLAVAAAVWARRTLAIFLVRRARLASRQLRAIRLEPLSALALLVSTLPVLLISLAHILPLVEGRPVAVSAIDALSGQMRLLWLYAGPLVVLAVTLIGYAVRERSPAFALSGSLLISAAVTLVSAFLVWLPLQGKDPLVVVTVLQWNALAVGIAGLAWLAGRPWIEAAALPGETGYWQRLFGVPLGVQVSLLLLLAGILSVWAVVVVVLFPAHLPESAPLLCHVSGWCTLLLAAVVGGWYFRSWLPSWGVHLAGFLTLSAVALIATATHAANGPHNWLAFHVLSAGWWLVALVATTLACSGAYLTRRSWLGRAAAWAGAEKSSLMAACGRWCSRSSRPLAVCATAIGCSVVLLAVRDNWIHWEGPDPNRPWWSTALVGGVAVLAAALAIRERSQPYAYASVVLAGLATSFSWVPLSDHPVEQVVIALVQAVTIAVSAACLVWVGIELWWQRKWSSVFDPNPHRMPVHHTCSVLAVTVLSLMLGSYLVVRLLGAIDVQGEALLQTLRLLSGTAGWLAVAGAGLLLVASLWDRTAAHAVPALYAWGLVAAVTVINRCESSVAATVFGIGLAAGVYVLVTGLLWFSRRWLAAAGGIVGLPGDDTIGRRVALWLPVCSVVLGGLAAVIAVGGSLCWEALWMRLWITTAVVMAAAGTALIVDARQRQSLQQSALLLGAAAAVALGWAVMTPEPQWLPREFWLPRMIRLMVMLAVTGFVYAALLPRCIPRRSDWLTSIRRIAVVAGGAGGAALLVVLGLEILVFDPRATAPILQIVIVAAALVGLIVALISLAAQRGTDPLGLTQRARMGYVYAAEVLAALLFLHIYLTMPELFGGIFLPYWPFIVMGIAFFAVGAGEVLNRSGLNALSEPLTRTGVFLPLLPAIGFWVAYSDRTLTGFTTLLFTVGLLYVLLSIWRGSFVYVVLAALAGNAALWSLLTDFDVSLWKKSPQFFMIPPALCVLAAVHFNRDRLTDAQCTAARYLALLTIYVSSTGQMFLPDSDDKIWPALVLASLSVVGVLAGMLLRIRAFVYLGASFLLLSILRMVWHATQIWQHSWPWWAFGIALGILIITMFGFFEKRRNEMQQMFVTFRSWEQ